MIVSCHVIRAILITSCLIVKSQFWKIKPCQLGNTTFFADIIATANFTIWLGPCSADGASVPDQSVTEIASFFWGDQLPKCHFYFFRFLDLVYEPHAIYDTDTMGIRDDGRFSEYISHDQIGAFSAHARQG